MRVKCWLGGGGGERGRKKVPEEIQQPGEESKEPPVIGVSSKSAGISPSQCGNWSRPSKCF